MNRRFKILVHWLSGRRNGVGLPELASFLFGRTSGPKAKARITGIKESDGCLAVSLSGLDRPLYYPLSFNISSLYQVIAEAFYADWHNYELPEESRTHLRPDDVVADCGAAEGLFSLMAAGRCKKVYAIEPLPAFVDSMRRTFNGIGNVELIEAGLADAPGKGFLGGADISSGITSSGAHPVRLETLDNIFYKRGLRLDYLKADLEGFEMKMLEGARETITADLPRMAITTYHDRTHAEAIRAFLKGINPAYNILVKGIEERAGCPVMLHAWVN
ncbi:MAG: FkbM family methyltransferase [Deltaproteobacteria bacterium]|nr:FkbM family methyltransferase [Deltaproteobacteria bacterium]